MYRERKGEVAVTKAEFVDKLAAKSGLTKKDAASVVDAFVEVITESLKKGEEVQFTGFGKFSCQTRGAREGINPQTKAKIKIPASKVPKFSAGVGLKNAVK
jgi:DNA-binding protein HU-beta